MKYLVIGATGNIGARVTQRLIARGERPRAATVSDGVKLVLGREAIAFDRWVEENAEAFQ
jgi:uncharacterized protein YbjT (DUF2867 family)